MDCFVEVVPRLLDEAPCYGYDFYSDYDSVRHLVDFCFPRSLVHSDRVVVLAHVVVAPSAATSDREGDLAHVVVVHYAEHLDGGVVVVAEELDERVRVLIRGEDSKVGSICFLFKQKTAYEI